MQLEIVIPTTTTESLTSRYLAVRRCTEALCDPLETEDYVLQTMTDVSPTRWHLAHVSWFFETFILEPYSPDYQPLNPLYGYLFNSYYIQAGERHCRDKRGNLSRPTVKEVYAYRTYVDDHMTALLGSAGDELLAEITPLVDIGLHHEQQHQELLLTDIKHVFSVNPLYPIYRERTPKKDVDSPMLAWVPFEEGLYEIGHDGDGFHYDNEGPRHRYYLQAYALANRLVTNGEFIAFMDDRGYQRPELWLSAGWATRETLDWTAPYYWKRQDGEWVHFTLAGLRAVDPDEPICHVSYFEADAYARWSGARLPTEHEWEVAAQTVPIQGNFVEHGHHHPVALGTLDAGAGPLFQMYGDVWEWTRSPYAPYPGYEPLPGALGEYNGKFMCNQFVLRGGSCATSISHIRLTYRNFFPPDACWQFMGIRLAKDL